MKITKKNLAAITSIGILCRHFSDLYVADYYGDKIKTKKNFTMLDELFALCIDTLASLAKGKDIKKIYSDNPATFLALSVLTSKKATQKDINTVLSELE